MNPEIYAEEKARKVFMDEAPEASFVMVNFLRFKPGGGSKEYGKYGSAFAKLIKEYGGEFVYRGRVAKRFVGEDEWHAVGLVKYPTRRAFYDLTTSDAYRKIHAHREDGLEKTLVYATEPVDQKASGLS